MTIWGLHTLRNNATEIFYQIHKFHKIIHISCLRTYLLNDTLTSVHTKEISKWEIMRLGVMRLMIYQIIFYVYHTNSDTSIRGLMNFNTPEMTHQQIICWQCYTSNTRPRFKCFKMQRFTIFQNIADAQSPRLSTDSVSQQILFSL